MRQTFIITLDVGGSSVKSGIVSSSRAVTDEMTTPINSNADADTIFGTLESIVRDHQQTIAPENLVGIALGFPGPCDYEAGICLIHGLAKYEAIYKMNIRTELAQRLHLSPERIRLRNDAEAAIVGEAKHGAGAGFSRIIGITLGTGLGSCHIADGQVQATGKGVPIEGWLGAVPYRGKLSDDFFSTRGLLTRLQEHGLAFESLEPALQQAKEGNPDVVAVYEAFGRDLGAFIQPYAHDFGAETILVLGGIAAAFPYFAPAMQTVLPHVQRGILGAKAPLLGAASLF